MVYSTIKLVLPETLRSFKISLIIYRIPLTWWDWASSDQSWLLVLKPKSGLVEGALDESLSWRKLLGSMDFFLSEPYKYLIITNHFTMYILAIPANDQKASTVEKCLWEQFLVHYTRPRLNHIQSSNSVPLLPVIKWVPILITQGETLSRDTTGHLLVCQALSKTRTNSDGVTL